MKRTRGMLCAALLLAAACGDGAAREPAAQAPADSEPAAAPVATEARAPVPLPAEVARDEQRVEEPAPTQADSQAGAREDVSPEWKMRARSMAQYEDCMAQARASEEPVRARLEAACARLPSAPR